MVSFNIKAGGLQHQFLNSTAKLQIIGGGFANGKTAASVIKAIRVAKLYPGANILIARATYPKLEDTIQKEFKKWISPDDIARFPNTKPPTCTLKNGTTINFRYVQQTGKNKGGEVGTSNLLSATYDLIVVDQIDDPEFSPKDLLDLMGRLRGNTQCIKHHPLLPKTGPRWLILTLNPTRNWIYKEWIAPLLKYQENGYMVPKLQEKFDAYAAELGITELEQFVQLFSAPTTENEDNLGADYIGMLKASYQGVMRERFLQGEWGAYEGLVYPTYNEDIHGVSNEQVKEWISRTQPKIIIEAFDHGLAVPSCYGLGFEDRDHNRVLIDGFYEAGLEDVKEITNKISAIRHEWGLPLSYSGQAYLDPALFKKTAGGRVADMIMEASDHRIMPIRANNAINAGVLKVGNYLLPREWHTNPFTKQIPGPHFYFNKDKCPWFDTEIVDYYWQADTDGTRTDKPQDNNDHAMDMVKYMMTDATPLDRLEIEHTRNMDFMYNWRIAS